MPLIAWGPQIALGIDRIDEQHKFLIDMMNTLSDRIRLTDNPKAALQAARGMIEYAEMHFGLEEEYMRKCGYPGLEAHLGEHEVFRAKAVELAQGCEKGSRRECLEVFDFLAHWAMEHIMGTDRLYVPCVRKVLGG